MKEDQGRGSRRPSSLPPLCPRESQPPPLVDDLVLHFGHDLLFLHHGNGCLIDPPRLLDDLLLEEFLARCRLSREGESEPPLDLWKPDGFATDDFELLIVLSSEEDSIRVRGGGSRSGDPTNS